MNMESLVERAVLPLAASALMRRRRKNRRRTERLGDAGRKRGGTASGATRTTAGNRAENTTGLARRETPGWTVAVAALAGGALGVGLGMWITNRRAASRARARGIDLAPDELKASWPDLEGSEARVDTGVTPVEHAEKDTGNEAQIR